MQVTRWTVDYGEGRLKEIRVPHSWRQDVDVRWEGPVSYKTLIDVPFKPSKLRFHGVSYLAEVHIDGHHEMTHEGIWDAFEVPLTAYRGKRVELEVRVTKNGGSTYPVKQTLSGFLPYVFHTFGGIFRPVEIVDESTPLTLPATSVNVPEEYLRGILHWGWYPELGHCHPTAEMIDQEIAVIQKLGFNTVKFCLWLPPHQYLQRLEEKGLYAWIELPLWLPEGDVFSNPRIENELEQIVRQYAHHSNVVAWTLGCELQNSPPEFRDKWVKKIQALTKCPWVKDNSGGAEMYGGDPREFGTFEDFHPYGEAHFLPQMFESLSLGPRTAKPILLGETIDHDVHRDLAQVAETMPFWASAMRELNDQGVRWQYDLPKFLSTNRFAHEPETNRHQELMQLSIEKALFVRKHTVEQLRSREDFAGYILTGMRDTPISSSGILTDWNRERYSPEQFKSWNGDQVLFLIPMRDPRWTRGGNRPAYRDLYNFFADESNLVKVGIAGFSGEGSAIWKLIDSRGQSVQEGIEPQQNVSTKPTQVAEIHLPKVPVGTYKLQVEFAESLNEWEMTFHPKSDFSNIQLSTLDDRLSSIQFGTNGVKLFVGPLPESIDYSQRQMFIVEGRGTTPMSYWRESFQIDAMPFHQALAVAPDCALDSEIIGKCEWLETRVDTRTYQEYPMIAKRENTVFTTYRVYGGHGTQPNGLVANPSGQSLLRKLSELV